MLYSNNFIRKLIVNLFIICLMNMLRMLDLDIFKIEQLPNYSIHEYSFIDINELLNIYTINGGGNKREQIVK